MIFFLFLKCLVNPMNVIDWVYVHVSQSDEKGTNNAKKSEHNIKSISQYIGW